MKTSSLETQSPIKVSLTTTPQTLTSFKNWVKKNEPDWEYNRLGISAAGIFIQVTLAGLMMGILGVADASPFVYTIGILFSFMANSLAFAQCKMRWVLGIMVASVVLDIVLMLYYGLPLL
ncbi:MAG TPA: hypothetical protein VGM31_10930 [Puia sp.]|jgi:hypothetical protein